jgi:phage-related protein
LSPETFFDDELYLVPPAVLPSVYGGLSFVLASQETKIGNSMRSILGWLSEGILSDIKGLISSVTNKAVGNVKFIPGELASGIKSAGAEIVEGVQGQVRAIPKQNEESR